MPQPIVTDSAIKGQIVTVETDVFQVKIDTLGGDVIEARLRNYHQDTTDADAGFELLTNNPQRFFIAQTGLLSAQGPDLESKGRSLFRAEQSHYKLAAGSDEVSVNLMWSTDAGILVTKRFVFHRNNYLVDIEYIVDNQSAEVYTGRLYGRLKRQADPDSGGGFFGVQTFTGAALFTADKPYKKISFDDMKKKNFIQTVDGGWAAMIEHYFLAALIPNPTESHIYQTRLFPNNSYGIEFVAQPFHVAAHHQGVTKTQLYMGPQLPELLGNISKGLELTVDYGILWPICQPIFWLMKKIHSYVGNWGLSIILITVLIKLVFYRLSAASYRSMGAMRKLQPEIEALKARLGDDKQQFGQALMELYRKEKVNPLGGCLPILIQIPVFIALYYVLLGSVELRHAAFFGWLHDLAGPDPYYILPLLMGVSMWVQQRLSPQPPDPMQAKVMMAMPVIFTVMFLNFPSGLVLYWVVNNVLSIFQQWYITRTLGR